MPLTLKETNDSNEHNRLKNPNWQGQPSWLYTRMTEGVNWGPPRINSSLVVRARLEPATSGFQVRRTKHSATLPPSSRLLICESLPLIEICSVCIKISQRTRLKQRMKSILTLTSRRDRLLGSHWLRRSLERIRRKTGRRLL